MGLILEYTAAVQDLIFGGGAETQDNEYQCVPFSYERLQNIADEWLNQRFPIFSGLHLSFDRVIKFLSQKNTPAISECRHLAISSSF